MNNESTGVSNFQLSTTRAYDFFNCFFFCKTIADSSTIPCGNVQGTTLRTFHLIRAWAYYFPNVSYNVYKKLFPVTVNQIVGENIANSYIILYIRNKSTGVTNVQLSTTRVYGFLNFFACYITIFFAKVLLTVLQYRV